MNYYKKQNKSTPKEFLADLAKFLTNELAGFTGPNWEVLDTYSSTATTKHEAPANGDIDDLAADNSWKTGDIQESDYIILQSIGTPKVTVGIEYESTAAGSFKIIVDPNNSWNVANNNDDMDDATNWGNRISSTTFYAYTSAANYSIIADSDHFKLFAEQNPSMNFGYYGLSADRNAGIAWNDSSNASYNNSNSLIKTLSLADNSTEISCYVSDLTANYEGFHSSTSGYSYNDDNSTYALTPAFIISNTSGHRGYYGKLIGMLMGSAILSPNNIKTLDSGNYLAFKNNNYEGGTIVLEWDGTAY